MRHRTTLVTLAAASCLLVATACGGEDKVTEDDLVEQVSESLQRGGDGFDKETADCFAVIVVDEVGVEELKDVDISADQPPEEMQPDIAAAMLKADEECDPTEG